MDVKTTIPATSSDVMTEKHLPATPPPAPKAVASNVSSNYGRPQSPSPQPTPARYAPGPYPQLGHINGISLPNSGPPASVSMGFTVLPPLGAPQPGKAQSYPTSMDTTGQIAPPGMKPRVTATLWEDEGSLCFQVEARGVCVARREDNHMINGTKLLNVAGIMRDRRDAMLKSEKVRHVVKIGPMHLKGVWIPFERALDFANKQKITEILYPLFVHNIGAVLYHPTNQTKTNQVMANPERRLETPSRSKPQTSNSGPALLGPKLEPLHHLDPPYPRQSSLTPPPRGRSQIQRVHYLPTPPTSGSIISSNKTSDKHQRYKLNTGSDPYADLMSIDPGLNNVRSMPILPPSSALNDQDEKSLPDQSGFRVIGSRRGNLNEAAVARSTRERSTKIRSSAARREAEVEEEYASSNEKEHVDPQSYSTPQSDTIGMDNDENTPEAPAERKYTHTQVDNLSPSQTSPQSDSERSSDSETGFLTRNERRSILLERLMTYFFELFSSCPSPAHITETENPHATPTLASANISVSDTGQQNRQGWTHASCDEGEYTAAQISLRRDIARSTIQPLPLPSSLPRVVSTINRRAPREDDLAPPPLPPPIFLDRPTDRQPPWLPKYEPKASFFSDNDYHGSNGQDEIPRQDGLDSATGQSNISASTAVSATMGSNAPYESTRPVQKRDRDGDDGEKDDRQPDKRTRLGENGSTAPKRLACPYFKKDPEHTRLGRSCSGPGWGTVHRIKEHLDRNHALPPSCVRCYTAFGTEAERDTHMRLQDQCQLQERPGRMYGFDAFQKEQLRSRPKGYKHMSETQKWCHIYMILFPETSPADIPSPYYEFGSLRDSGHPVDPMIEYENFLRHEMPDRVRHQLELRIEEALNPLEETLRGQIVDIVRDVQLELFQSFRASAGPARPDSHSAQESATTEVNDDPEEIRDNGRGDNDVPESTSVRTNADPQSDWEEQMQPFRPVPPLDFPITDFDGELFDFSSLVDFPAAQDSTYGTLSMSQAETDKDAFVWNGMVL